MGTFFDGHLPKIVNLPTFWSKNRLRKILFFWDSKNWNHNCHMFDLFVKVELSQ